MGSSKYGIPSGSLPSGGAWTTAVNEYTETRIINNAHTLLLAVSSSIAAAVTGSSGAGSMDAPIKATLSASYATAVTARV